MILFALGLLFAVAAAGAFYHRIYKEKTLKTEPLTLGHKTCLVEPLLLPISVTTILFMLALTGDSKQIETVLTHFASLLLSISVYYVILLLLLPLLRRYVSAFACATLWLVPSVLYTTAQLSSAFLPRFVISVSRAHLRLVFTLWVVGFLITISWQFLSHMYYRHTLLQHARPFTERTARELWRRESIHHGIKADIPVLVSDAISSPVAVGCFDRSMRLILPNRSYTDAEFQLIVRHELRHIMRADMRTKLFLGLYAAVCWFNPLSWVMRRKASDDLELSCDEAVLADFDADTRIVYAELLLKSADSGRGFSTCLSASASSLRYRLHHVVHPKKTLPGGVLIALATVALFSSLGMVSLADESVSVQTAVFTALPSDIFITDLQMKHESDTAPLEKSTVSDEAALTAYLSSLQVKPLYKKLSYDSSLAPVLYVDYTNVAGDCYLHLSLVDRFLYVTSRQNKFETVAYYLEEELDWAYLDALLR